VKNLSIVQTKIEEHESTWLKYKELINLQTEMSKKEQKSTPKYSQPKPSTGMWRSFLIEDISNQAPVKEEKDGKRIFLNLNLDKKALFVYSEELKKLKPLGLYAWGGPGCGKTFLMDMTYDLLETKYKTRMHYNEFMLRIHQKNFHFSNVTA
jgi:predicted ATPase